MESKMQEEKHEEKVRLAFLLSAQPAKVDCKQQDPGNGMVNDLIQTDCCVWAKEVSGSGEGSGVDSRFIVFRKQLLPARDTGTVHSCTPTWSYLQEERSAERVRKQPSPQVLHQQGS